MINRDLLIFPYVTYEFLAVIIRNNLNPFYNIIVTHKYLHIRVSLKSNMVNLRHWFIQMYF